MKRIFSYIILFVIISLFGSNVYALDEKLELISKDSSTTISFENLTYTNVRYSATSGKNGEFIFESINNNTEKKLPISINILLFNSSKYNIGYLTYCSEKDYDSNYSQFTLRGNEATPFSIDVYSRYLTSGKTGSDIAYFAIQDDNKYCHIGGYDKYSGFTFDDIVSGTTFESKDNGFEVYDLSSKSVRGTIIALAIIIAFYIFRGLLLNALYKKMYAKASALSYFPIGSEYVSVKLAFGNIIAKYYIIVFLLSLPLSIVVIGRILSYILSFVAIVSFIIDIIKLVTRKYYICLYEGKSNNVETPTDSNSNGEKVETLDEFEAGDTINNNSEFLNSNSISGDEMVDLSYSQPDNSNTFPDFSQSNQGTQNNSSNNNEESDLTNMFR